MSYSFDALSEELMLHLDVPRETLPALKSYGDMLVKWQSAKNLVSKSTLPDLWRRHFLDSAQLYPLLKKHIQTERPVIMDIGSGAGFPGLVLAALNYGNVHIVEANSRKCVFMSQVARQTNTHVAVHNQRIEKLSPFPVDIITSRACASIVQLLEWAEPFVNQTTELWFLKGTGVDEELTQAQQTWNMEIDSFISRSDKTGKIIRLRHVKRLAA